MAEPFVPDSEPLDGEDSEAYLESFFKTTLGISGIGKWASQRANEGYSVNWITQAIRFGTDNSEGGQAVHNAYLTAFPGMNEFIQDKVFTGPNPEMQYLAYKNSVEESAARYGVNPELVSPQKIYTYLKNDISASEINDRMSTAAAAIATTPEETLAVLNQYYGVGSSDLLSFFLDTDETEATLQKRYTAARIGTEAARNEFGVNAAQAEALANRGVNTADAAQGFQTAAQRRSLTGGMGETATEEQLIGASFGDVAAEETVARISASRAGRFAEGGGFTATQEGVSGLGSATR